MRQLVELTAAVEKASGATARLLWSELGESLAQRLAARLGSGKLSVRFTIERMRTLVLAAGVLLVVALAAFLAVGKWKHRFNVQELPKPLGVDIQQEANGFTFSHALGAHSQYKIHASKVVQLKTGQRRAARREDRAVWRRWQPRGPHRGRRVRVRPEERIATAAGPVEITLMRPGVAPAIAPKATPGKVMKPKSSQRRWPQPRRLPRPARFM